MRTGVADCGVNDLPNQASGLRRLPLHFFVAVPSAKQFLIAAAGLPLNGLQRILQP
jgi:hypothetical protein